ncbi:sulfurtransferase [Leptolyngbya sp. FACHB-321]|uniref:sulfurtransferase n=1 Tax=Leptolyngbya sp. FACHB-321 TaxID=2692807 RepID=UPI001684D09F|nr:sulfurtransferase [Leptolyngbya sp. FACHB-321]MBD2035870.1 sulfurtransferase [Leptolyngbya sp. FACHB-321]
MRLNSLWAKLKKPRTFAFLATLVASLLVIPVLPASIQAATSKATIQFVAPDWVAAHAKDANLSVLDVRTAPLEYIAGHLPRAVNIADSNFRGPNGVLPVQYWDNTKLADTFSKAGVSNRSKVLVYSSGNDVLGATMVAYLLERSGVKEIAVLDGGYAGYKNANQPVTKEFPRYSPGKFVLKDDPSIRVNLSQVQNLIGKPGVVFIDPRPPELFRGEKDIWIRNGHIPGAKNIPWPTFTEANNAQESLKNPHKLKSLSEIRALLAERGIKPSDDIIVSCSTGREATLQYVVLKHLLGYPKVRVYEGSWTEYSTTDLPVATGPEKTLTSTTN